MPFKTFANGEESLAADVNTYLMKQAVATFPTAAARTAGITTPVKGMVTARDDAANVAEMWDGAVWVPVVGPERLFGRTVNQAVAVGGSSTYSLALPAAPMAGGIILDAMARVDSASGTFTQTVAIALDATSSPAASSSLLNQGSINNAITSLQLRLVAAWTGIARAQVVTAVIKVTNTGGSSAVNWARLEGQVRYVPVLGTF